MSEQNKLSTWSPELQQAWDRIKTLDQDNLYRHREAGRLRLHIYALENEISRLKEQLTALTGGNKK